MNDSNPWRFAWSLLVLHHLRIVFCRDVQHVVEEQCLQPGLVRQQARPYPAEVLFKLAETRPCIVAGPALIDDNREARRLLQFSALVQGPASQCEICRTRRRTATQGAPAWPTPMLCPRPPGFPRSHAVARRDFDMIGPKKIPLDLRYEQV